MDVIVNQDWAVYQYNSSYYTNNVAYPLSGYKPRDGQLMVVAGTPYFSGRPILIYGYNNLTVQQLVQNAAAQATSADILAAIAAETMARQNADTAEANIRASTDNALTANKQDKKPDGVNNLIGTDQKINTLYLPAAILGGLVYGGSFNASGIITSSSYAPALQGVKIDNVPTAQYPGYYFVSQASYSFAGYTFTKGDWAVSQGAHSPAWIEIDNGNSVSSVNGMIGAVVLTKVNVGLGNVDNTADVDKPVSLAQQSAIAAAKQEALDAVGAEEAARSDADAGLRAELDTKAPIDSPHLTDVTDVPTTPDPDFTRLDQIANVKAIVILRDILFTTILVRARTTYPNSPFMPPVRVSWTGHLRGTYI